MTDDDGDGTYSITIEKEAGTALSYRFSYQNGEDPWTNYVEETVPAECSNELGFREIMLPNFDISLDAIEFGTCAGDPVNVTLQVDLNYIEDLYEGGAVWVYMDPGWSEYYDMTDDDGDGIYTYTVAVSPGNELTYRFSYQNGPDPWSNYHEESVPDACSNDDGFRTYTVPNTHVTLQPFVYGSCGEEITPSVNITFQVDMNHESNPNNVMVVIKNPWIWTALTDQGDGIWSASVEVDANKTYPFTYVNGGQDNWDEEESVPEECNFGTESAPERHVTVEEEDLVLDIVSFGECDYISNAEELSTLGIEVFPNPSKGRVVISIDDDQLKSVQLFDIHGKLLKSFMEINNNNIELDIHDLTHGMYIIQLNGVYTSAVVKLMRQ
jgi:hypothetical protein